MRGFILVVGAALALSAKANGSTSTHTTLASTDGPVDSLGRAIRSVKFSRTRRNRRLGVLVDNKGRSPSAVVALRTSTLKTKENSLVLVNMVMFFFYAVLGSVMPFIPLYYGYLGVGTEHIGTLGAITPTVTFLVSPLWGALADATGLEKEIMLGTFVLSTAIRFLLVYANQFRSMAAVISVLVALSAVINAPVKPLLDACVMGLLKDKSLFGRSRLFGQLGFGLGSWLVGPFLGKSDIRNIFVVQTLLAVPTAGLMLEFVRRGRKEKALVKSRAPVGRVDEKKQKLSSSASASASASSDFTSALRHVAKNSNILVFFTFVFLLGVSSGIIENFAYVHLKDCSSYNGNALGVCRLASSLAGVPMFYLAGSILKTIGVNGVLGITMTAYVARFALYATMTNTWQALPAEVLRGATFALFTTASTYHVYQASPPALVATMLSLLSGTYNGLGQSVGSLLGGLFSKHFGIVRVFVVCAAIDALLAVIFATHIYRTSPSSQEINNVKMKEKDKVKK